MCLSAESEIARSFQLVTKISDFCNEVNDYLIKPPYYTGMRASHCVLIARPRHINNKGLI